MFTLRAGARGDVFFFSNRRRHTISYGDWSSDVCSSDLFDCLAQLLIDLKPRKAVELRQGSSQLPFRSEERRVGKECRSRGWPHHTKKNTASRGVTAELETAKNVEGDATAKRDRS